MCALGLGARLRRGRFLQDAHSGARAKGRKPFEEGSREREREAHVQKVPGLGVCSHLSLDRFGGEQEVWTCF